MGLGSGRPHGKAAAPWKLGRCTGIGAGELVIPSRCPCGHQVPALRETSQAGVSSSRTQAPQLRRSGSGDVGATHAAPLCMHPTAPLPANGAPHLSCLIPGVGQPLCVSPAAGTRPSSREGTSHTFVIALSQLHAGGKPSEDESGSGQQSPLHTSHVPCTVMRPTQGHSGDTVLVPILQPHHGTQTRAGRRGHKPRFCH